MLDPFIEVGSLVRHPAMPEWGVGQVQSIIGDRVTVNFRDAGKVVLQGPAVQLVIVSDEDEAR